MAFHSANRGTAAALYSENAGGGGGGNSSSSSSSRGKGGKKDTKAVAQAVKPHVAASALPTKRAMARKAAADATRQQALAASSSSSSSSSRGGSKGKRNSGGGGGGASGIDDSEPAVWSVKWSDFGDEHPDLVDPNNPGQVRLRDQTHAACGLLLACAAARAVGEETVRVTLLRDEKLIEYLKKEMTKAAFDEWHEQRPLLADVLLLDPNEPILRPLSDRAHGKLGSGVAHKQRLLDVEQNRKAKKSASAGRFFQREDEGDEEKKKAEGAAAEHDSSADLRRRLIVAGKQRGVNPAAKVSLAMLEGVNALSFASIRSPFSASARVTR